MSILRQLSFKTKTQLEFEEAAVIPSSVISKQNGKINGIQDQPLEKGAAMVLQNEMISENSLTTIEPVSQVTEKEHNNLGNGFVDNCKALELAETESELDSQQNEDREWVLNPEYHRVKWRV